MRVAVLSDLHANRHALEAVAKDAAGRGVQEHWCLGDVVGYGAHPREVLQWVEAHARLIVKGNHDQAVATGDHAWFNDSAATAARYHAQLLDPGERARIYGWPLDARRQVLGTEVLLVHASPDDPLREYVFPPDAERGLQRWSGLARIVLLGHTHVPFVALRQPAAGGAAVPDARAAADADRVAPAVDVAPGSSPARMASAAGGAGAARAAGASGALSAANAVGTAGAAASHGPGRAQDAADAWRVDGFAQVQTRDAPDAPLVIVNPGSVGQPRDNDPRASYAILDFERRVVELHRVAYDVEAAAQAIQRAGLPAGLAMRLLRGR